MLALWAGNRTSYGAVDSIISSLYLSAPQKASLKDFENRSEYIAKP